MHKYLIRLILILSYWPSFGQEAATSQRILWGYGVDQFYNAKIISSEKIVLLGRTDSHRNGGYQNKDGWVVMLSAEGDTLWSKSYGGRSRTDRFWDMEQLPNKDLLFVGSSGSFLGSENVYVVRTDSTGKLLSSFNYGEKGFDTAEDIELLKDGGWFIIGKSKSGTQESDYPFRILMIRCNENGDPIWMKTIESAGETYGIKSLIDDDNNIYILGNVKRDNRFYITLQCYDSNGELKLAKTFKGHSSKGECSTDMIFGLNGSIYISGYTIDSSFSGLLMEVDLKGKIKKTRMYTSQKDLEFTRIVQDADSSLWAVGYCTEDSISTSGPVVQLGSNLQVLKSHQFQPFNKDVYFSTVRILSDTQMLLVGSHLIPEGNERGAYFSIINKQQENMSYEKDLFLSESDYPLEPIKAEYRVKNSTGFSPVQSLLIPVTVNVLEVK